MCNQQSELGSTKKDFFHPCSRHKRVQTSHIQDSWGSLSSSIVSAVLIRVCKKEFSSLLLLSLQVRKLTYPLVTTRTLTKRTKAEVYLSYFGSRRRFMIGWLDRGNLIRIWKTMLHNCSLKVTRLIHRTFRRPEVRRIFLAHALVEKIRCQVSSSVSVDAKAKPKTHRFVIRGWTLRARRTGCGCLRPILKIFTNKMYITCFL